MEVRVLSLSAKPCLYDGYTQNTSVLMKPSLHSLRDDCQGFDISEVSTNAVVAQWWSICLESRQPERVCRFESYLQRLLCLCSLMDKVTVS